MGTTKYFSGAVELAGFWPLSNARFAAIGGKPSKHNYYDSFNRLAGYILDDQRRAIAFMPVTRKIEYKSEPSLHVCNSRCRSANGHSCECSCGGANHGIDA